MSEWAIETAFRIVSPLAWVPFAFITFGRLVPKHEARFPNKINTTRRKISFSPIAFPFIFLTATCYGSISQNFNHNYVSALKKFGAHCEARLWHTLRTTHRYLSPRPLRKCYMRGVESNPKFQTRADTFSANDRNEAVTLVFCM